MLQDTNFEMSSWYQTQTLHIQAEAKTEHFSLCPELRPKCLQAAWEESLFLIPLQAIATFLRASTVSY